jgi:hypothetical protein
MTSDSKLLEFEILEFSSIFYLILASTRVLEFNRTLLLVTNSCNGVYNNRKTVQQHIEYLFNVLNLSILEGSSQILEYSITRILDQKVRVPGYSMLHNGITKDDLPHHIQSSSSDS